MATEDDINTIQAWCPECHGSGMVMEFEPVDCPNIDLHKLLSRLEEPDELLSRWEAAALLDITIPTLTKLMDAKLMPYVTVGRTYVFRRREVEGMKLMIQEVVNAQA